MNILIVKLSAIGDVIHALPVTQALRNRYPDCHITWVVEPIAAAIVRHNPCVDEVIIFYKRDFKTVKGFIHNFLPFYRQLHQRHYDLSIDLQGLGKSAIIALLAGATRKVGYVDMREGAGFISKPLSGSHAQGHIVDRYLDVTTALGCPLAPVTFPLSTAASEQQKITELLAGRDISRYVVLALGTNWPNKCWAPENFARLAELLQKQQLPCILIGYGTADEDRAQQLLDHCQVPVHNLIGQTSLMETAELLRRAEAVVGGDTGNLHLAVAVNTPALMLMGPTNPERNGPYQVPQQVILAGRACDGCWQRKCPHHWDCLSTITPEQVYTKLLTILATNK